MNTEKTNEDLFIQLTWATNWLRNTYGLEEGDALNAGEVEELLEQAIYDFQKEQKKRDWEEFREMVEDTVEFSPSYLDVSRDKILEKIDSKLKEL